MSARADVERIAVDEHHCSIEADQEMPMVDIADAELNVVENKAMWAARARASARRIRHQLPG